MSENEEDAGGMLPPSTWKHDPAANNLAGVLLIPRVSNFRTPVTLFRQAIGEVDMRQRTALLALVPDAIAEDEAFQRTAQHFRYELGSLLRVPQAATRGIRYTWAAQVVDEVAQMVSLEGKAWLEFVRDPKARNFGTVVYSTAATGHEMPVAVAAAFEEAYRNNLTVFGTADCRDITSRILKQIAAKLIGRNIWFVPAVAGHLSVFEDVLNTLNRLAGYTALVAFEITKTPQNDTVAAGVITEVFARQMREAGEAVAEYKADLATYNANPVGRRMNYMSRAQRGITDVNVMVKEAALYADVLGLISQDAVAQVAALQQQWEAVFAYALGRDGKFEEAGLIVDLMKTVPKKS